MPNTNISMCVTSCNRHDLLKTTLESFYAVVDQEPQELLIYEDSAASMPEWLREPIWKQRGLRWLQGAGENPIRWVDGSENLDSSGKPRERRGQAFACARLIAEAKHDYIFWCEDDWFFHNRISPFMRESKAILDGNPRIIQVSLRGNTGWHPLIKEGDLWIPEPYWRGVWGGWAWNPGLRRARQCKDIILPAVSRQIGKDGLQHEEALSKMLLDEGYRIADLNRPVITHIGGGRSRAYEKLPALPKILIAVPTCWDFDYETRWEHKGNPEYGKDMHVSGPNDQTQAVRETWGADVAAFENVTLRFFYGKPKGGFPRAPLADEVFLECPDAYGSLPLKTVGICQYAAENGYKTVYKCDTDTYVRVEKLLIEILENNFEYAGYLHGGVCSGGPGYLLSQRACQIIYNQGHNPQHWAEDVHVSKVLKNAGIVPLMLQGHRPGFSAHFYFGDGKAFDPSRITDDVITAHAVFPEQMRRWHNLTAKKS
jgi:Galactosyltransferase